MDRSEEIILKVIENHDKILKAIENHDHVTLKKALCELGHAIPRMRTKEGINPVIYAVEHGNLEAIKILCQFDASVSLFSVNGTTPCTMAKLLGFQEIVDYLESLTDPDLQAISDAKVNLIVLEERTERIPELFEAIDNNNIDDVRGIINSGTDVNSRFEDGITPLIQAAYNGNFEMVKFLVQNGGDVNLFDAELETALLGAYSGNFQDIVNYLTPLTSQEVQDMVREQLDD
jgi:ankyrin repeat protein